jgi:hypothetical protein
MSRVFSTEVHVLDEGDPLALRAPLVDIRLPRAARGEREQHVPCFASSRRGFVGEECA